MSGTATVQIGSKSWSVELALTSSEITQGLSGRASMPAGQGMLFDLGFEQIITVNAYNMLFPLSVVFIGEDLKVTEVAQSLNPGEDGTTAYPCRYFLEVNLGEVIGMISGNQVTITGYIPPAPANITAMMQLMMTGMIAIMMMTMMTEMVEKE